MIQEPAPSGRGIEQASAVCNSEPIIAGCSELPTYIKQIKNSCFCKSKLKALINTAIPDDNFTNIGS
jgi:hypothetical protein